MLARSGIVLGCALLSGCSFLIDVERDQCSVDGDCDRAGVGGACVQGLCVGMSSSPARCDGGSCSEGSDGGTGDAGPSCGGARCEAGEICFAQQCAAEEQVEPFVCELAEPPPAKDSVLFRMPVRDFVSDEPLPELIVLACRENDVSCTDPVARFEDPEGTGDVELELPYEFQGYLEVSSPAALTSLWYFTEPLIEDRTVKVLKAVAPSTAALLGSISGISIDASKGIVILEAFDCARKAAGGIHFEESKRSAIPFFIINDLPNIEGTVTVRNEVEDQAAGGFVNATPGFTLFSARVGVDGPVLGEVNANVKANTVTYIDIYP